MTTRPIQDAAAPQKRGRVLLVTNIPTPYRIPLLNEVSCQLAARGFTLKVVFAATGYARRKWRIQWDACDFEYEVLRGAGLAVARGEGVMFPYGGLLRLLLRERADIVIATGFSIGTMKVWLHSIFRRTPFVLWSGSVANAHRRVSAVRRLQRRLVVQRAAGFIAYGSAARDYLIALGAESTRCHIAINTVDTTFFRDEAERWRGRLAPAERHELLYVGNLTAGKRLDRLIEAVSVLRRRRDDFVLRLVGDGPERERLVDLAAGSNISDAVFFEGFRQRDEIPRYLAAAHCFVFPSEYDVWGLVLVEAMAAAVPCVSSIYAGATADLIEDGVTGFAADFAETEAVADRIEWMLDHPEKAARIGNAGQDFIQRNVQIDHSASGVVDALLQSLNGAKQR